MKQAQHIIIFLAITLLFTCGQNSYEKELNGKWYGIDNDGYTKMHFYPDRLVFSEEFTESVEWKASKDKIEFSLPSNLWLDSIQDVTITYRLSKTRDTLFGSFSNTNGQFDASLMRVDNYIEYLNKRYGVNLSLPVNDSVKNLNYYLKNSLDPMYGLKVFIGQSGKSLYAKTELSNNLSTLESDIKTFKSRIKPSQHPLNYHREILNDEHISLLENRFHFRVFADKSISDEMITKSLSISISGDNSFYKRIQSKTPDSLSIKVFRIYDNKEMEKNSGIRGREINTNAFYFYN